MQLIRLSPAEYLVLQHRTKAPARHMLRLTFLDLLLRDVLRLEHRTFQSTPHDPPVAYPYVRPGDAALTHQPLPHERTFLDVLPPGRQMILLRYYVGVLLEKLPPPTNFRNLVADSPKLKECIKRNGWHQFWGTFDLSEAGYLLGAQVHGEAMELRQQLIRQEITPSDLPAELYATAMLVGSAPPPELRVFDEELLRQLRSRRGQQAFFTDWRTGVGTGSSPDSGDADFGGGEPGGGGASGDFGSGCSGDGGCSGCGGGGD